MTLNPNRGHGVTKPQSGNTSEKNNKNKKGVEGKIAANVVSTSSSGSTCNAASTAHTLNSANHFSTANSTDMINGLSEVASNNRPVVTVPTAALELSSESMQAENGHIPVMMEK